jgi:tRNA(Ile)-lysidine synthase
MMRGTTAGLTFLHVRQVLDCALRGRNGLGVDLLSGIHVRRTGDHLVVELGSLSRSAPPISEWAEGVPLSIPGEIRFAEGGRRLVAVPSPPDEGLREADRWQVTIDADRLGGSLTVRSWRPGDWFCPRGMHGHRKKLQDFFVDEKVPRASRRLVPIVVSPAGIVWVAGYRCDERFVAGAETVRPVSLRVIGEA